MNTVCLNMCCVSVTRWGGVDGRGQAEAADAVRPVQDTEKGTQHNTSTHRGRNHQNPHSNDSQTALVGTEMLPDFVRTEILDV